MNTLKYYSPFKLLLISALTISLLTGFETQATDTDAPVTYYGADLQKMTAATGVNFEQPNTVLKDGPWPQRAGNYCFIAVVQAMVNYVALEADLPVRYTTQDAQGPASGNPADETKGQILYDMDHHMIPPNGPLKVEGIGKNRRPFTLANIAYDFGGDPRTQAFAVNYEKPGKAFYHEHIYHNGAKAATQGIAKALATYKEPIIVLVDHGAHSVIVAGVWATGNPLTDKEAKIQALAVYNPWDQGKGAYLSNSYYIRVSYEDWISKSWFSQPYKSNGNSDPDPSISRYQAGTGTLHPDARHWLGNYVIIQRDNHPVSADYTYDENDQLMTKP